MSRLAIRALSVALAVLSAVGCWQQMGEFRADADVAVVSRGDAGIDAIDGSDAGIDAIDGSDAGIDAVDAVDSSVDQDAGTSDADAAAAEAGIAACARFCATINALRCPSDDPSLCIGQCESVAAEPSCGHAYSLLVACGADRSAGDFHCDGHSGTLNDGVCADQAQTFADCLLFGP